MSELNICAQRLNDIAKARDTSIEEYNSIATKLLDIVLKKTYDSELKWTSSFNADNSIKYETVIMPQRITMTVIIPQFVSSPIIYVTIDNECTQINWTICNTVKNSVAETMAYELKCVLSSNSDHSVFDKLKNLII